MCKYISTQTGPGSGTDLDMAESRSMQNASNANKIIWPESKNFLTSCGLIEQCLKAGAVGIRVQCLSPVN